MEIRSATTTDWPVFLTLAKEEGWQVPRLEIDLFAGPLRGGAFALLEGGVCRGFVTTAAYPRSGWIGNLILAPEERGKGTGGRLFDFAVGHLEQRGSASIILTASALGRPLYEKRGFRSIGTIERWRHDPEPRRNGLPPFDHDGREALCQLDALAWEEARSPLLSFLSERGQTFVAGLSCLHVQEGEDMQILGPWYSASRRLEENGRLLRLALDAVQGAAPLFTDLLAESGLSPLLSRAGFRPCGSTALMVKGECPAELGRHLVSLASLGSLG